MPQATGPAPSNAAFGLGPPAPTDPQVAASPHHLAALRPPARPPTRPEFAPGTRVDQYELKRFIGAGGMGEVYEARRDGRQLRYALKILPPADDGREGTLLEIAEHPLVVPIHDRGTFTDPQGRTRHFLAMRLVRGARPLTDHADHHRLSLDQRVGLIIDVCRAMEAMHPKVCHFDLKPANILVGEDGVVQVSDMGLARLATDLALTPPGGTTVYASPEQLTLPVADLDHRADQYALAATLYELVTGRTPVVMRGDMSAADVLRAKEQPPAPLSRTVPEADDALDSIVRRGLSFSRDARYPDTRAFREALVRWRAGRSTLRTRLGRAMARPRARAGVKFAVAALAGALLGAGVLAPLAGPLVRWESGIAAPPLASVGDGGFQHVRLIALPETPDQIEQLAADTEITGVVAHDRPTWRRVHARLCERVAGVASVVVFDISFNAPDDADADLARAIRLCQARRTTVVLCSERRDTDAQGVPSVSRALWMTDAPWGYSTILPDQDGRSMVPLLTVDERGEVFPALSLAAAAAEIGSGAVSRFTLDQADRIATTFWAPGARPNDLRRLSISDTVIPTSVQPWVPRLGGENWGFGAGDRLACFRADVPSPVVRGRITITAADLLLDDRALTECQRRVVVIADPSRDLRIQGPGESGVPAAYLHAATIEALLARRGLRLWGGAEHVGPIVAASLLGAGVGMASIWTIRRVGPPAARPGLALAGALPCRWIVLALLMVAAWSGAAVLARSTGALLSPVPFCCSLLVAAEAAALIAVLSASNRKGT